jgi:aminomuconate-semialdehyde/2-hydroxymuconate-6-semialdehyde dehydrogenase
LAYSLLFITFASSIIYLYIMPHYSILNYINGELISPVNGSYLSNTNPANGLSIGSIPDSDEQDIDLATKAAKQAFASWSNTKPEERFAMLLKVSELILENLEAFAIAEATDSGKTITAARTIDIPRAAQNFRFFAAAALQFSSESHYLNNDSIHYTLRQPLGVVGCISPWNLPLYLFTWKIAPALAAGCTVVAKPSEVTPVTAFLLSEVCQKAGLPKGVLNIVHGLGAKVGNPMSIHPDIKAISFTGSTATGRIIAEKAAPLFKKLSFELGGKNPTIIFEDCDWGKMIETTVRSSFNNLGQICLCGSRIFIQRTVYERFKNDFIPRVKALRVGNPMDENNNLGAVVSTQHFHKVLKYIEIAKNEGATILTGGEVLKMEGDLANGNFIAPTILENLTYDCSVNQEEIFGPVVSIIPFDTEEEVLMMANSTSYGLASIVWTEHLSRALRLSHHLQSGIVWVNDWMKRDLRTPFGGKKDSGVGREGGWEAMRFFTDAKNVAISFEH